EEVRIQDVDLFRNFMVVVEKTMAVDRLRVFNFRTSAWSEIAFPEPVYSASPGMNHDYEAPAYRYNYQSMVTPPGVYDFEVASGRSTLLKRQEVPGGFDPSHYQSERLWATARDGT